MVRKTTPTDEEKFDPEAFDSPVGGQARDSAQQIWLAGMGAFAKAQAGGRQMFETLVKEGASLQKKTQSAAEDRFGDVASRMSGMAGDVSAKAGQGWGKLETIFEERTARAMSRLGVPSARDVEALTARIDELAAKVAQLTKRPRSAASRKTTAHSGTAPRPGAKRTPR